MAHEPIGDWTVTDPYGGGLHTFVQDVPAMAYAIHHARSDRATIITAPGGEQTLLVRVNPRELLVCAVVQLAQPAGPLAGGRWPT